MRIIETGVLTVSGSSSVEIELKEKPHKVAVCFIGEPPTIPCNPQSQDEVKCHIAHKKSFFGRKHYYIVIIWQVSSTREIEWGAFE